MCPKNEAADKKDKKAFENYLLWGMTFQYIVNYMAEVSARILIALYRESLNCLSWFPNPHS